MSNHSQNVQISHREIKVITRALDYLEGDIMKPIGAIEDLFQRMQGVISYSQQHHKLAPDIDLPVVFSDSISTALDQRRIRKHFGTSAFLTYSIESYEWLHSPHFSHRIFFDLYEHAVEQYCLYVLKLGRRQTEIEISKRISDIRFSLALNPQMVPSFAKLIDMIYHPAEGDFMFSGTGTRIYALGKSMLGDPLIRMTLIPAHKKADPYTLSRLDLRNQENRQVQGFDDWLYRPTVYNEDLIKGLIQTTKLDAIISQVFSDIGKINNYSIPGEVLHNCYEHNISGERFVSVCISNIETPELHDLILLKD